MSETNGLRSLATKALERLERNTPRNKIETKPSNFVSEAQGVETKIQRDFLAILGLKDAYEERQAIAEYDGGLDPDEANRIACRDAFLNTISSLPIEIYHGDDWLEQMVRDAQQYLSKQGLRCS